MKKLIGCLALLFIASCSDISYDPETRFVFRSHLTDFEGNPAVGVKSEMQVATNAGSDLLSVAYSDDNGDVEMVFPKAKGSALYSVRFARVSSQYQAVRIDSIPTAAFAAQNYTLFEQMRLDRIGDTVTLSIVYEQASADTILTLAYVSGILGTSDAIYGNDLVPDLEYEAKLYKNQTATLHYETRNLTTNEVVQHEVEIPIGETDLTYTLNY